MFKTLLKQIGDYKRDAVLTPIFVILEVIMEVIIPMMMAAIIDYGLTGQSLNHEEIASKLLWTSNTKKMLLWNP